MFRHSIVPVAVRSGWICGKSAALLEVVKSRAIPTGSGSSAFASVCALDDGEDAPKQEKDVAQYAQNTFKVQKIVGRLQCASDEGGERKRGIDLESDRQKDQHMSHQKTRTLPYPAIAAVAAGCATLRRYESRQI